MVHRMECRSHSGTELLTQPSAVVPEGKHRPQFRHQHPWLHLPEAQLQKPCAQGI